MQSLVLNLVGSDWIRIQKDPDLAGSKVSGSGPDPDPAGSKVSGSGLDPDPARSSNSGSGLDPDPVGSKNSGSGAPLDLYLVITASARHNLLRCVYIAMVFMEEDKIAIKFLREKKHYGACPNKL